METSIFLSLDLAENRSKVNKAERRAGALFRYDRLLAHKSQIEVEEEQMIMTAIMTFVSENLSCPQPHCAIDF